MVTVQETAGGTTLGTFTINGNSSVVLEKLPTHTVFAANADVLGAKVGYTGN